MALQCESTSRNFYIPASRLQFPNMLSLSLCFGYVLLASSPEYDVSVCVRERVPSLTHTLAHTQLAYIVSVIQVIRSLSRGVFSPSRSPIWAESLGWWQTRCPCCCCCCCSSHNRGPRRRFGLRQHSNLKEDDWEASWVSATSAFGQVLEDRQQLVTSSPSAGEREASSCWVI